MMTRELHLKRVERLLRDLDIVPAALLPSGTGFAIIDGVAGRSITPALANQTLAEGLVSAIKLSAFLLAERQARQALPMALEEILAAAEALADAVHFDEAGTWVGFIQQGGNGGLLSRETLQKADQVKMVVAQCRRENSHPFSIIDMEVLS